VSCLFLPTMLGQLTPHRERDAPGSLLGTDRSSPSKVPPGCDRHPPDGRVSRSDGGHMVPHGCGRAFFDRRTSAKGLLALGAASVDPYTWG
jgi:hypothetical protein